MSQQDDKPPREFWIDISDCIEDEDALPVAFLEHPQQGPLVWQSMLIHVIEKSAYDSLEARLKIAVDALESIAEPMGSGHPTAGLDWWTSEAQEALSKIREVK